MNTPTNTPIIIKKMNIEKINIEQKNKKELENNFIIKLKNLIMELIVEKYERVMSLKIFIDTDSLKKNTNMTNEEIDILVQKYKESIESHNKKVISSEYINAGFDLFITNKMQMLQTCDNEILITVKANHYIKCSAHMITSTHKYPTGYYLYPRSSIYKTPYRLANSTGIIDSGYRGHIMAMLDLLMDDFEIKNIETEPVRLTQICGPGLCPIYVEMVESVDDLGKTERGEGGFGSTGK